MPGDPDRCPKCGNDRAYGYDDDAHVMTCDACGYSEATDLRRQLSQALARAEQAEARILWLTIATTAEPDDPEELVQWLRGRRTYYEELARQARQEALESLRDWVYLKSWFGKWPMIDEIDRRLAAGKEQDDG